MLKVALLSSWHVHAWDYANQLRKLNDVQIITVWDEEPEKGKAWAKELGVDFEADLDTLLARSDVDAVVVTTPTNLHAKVMVAAAKAGKHIFTEKVMAPTVKECLEIEAAVKEAGVKFCISFPHRIFPHNLFAKKVVEENLLGDITLVRVRNAHNGAVGNWLPPHFYNQEQCGGGAMMDLGAHPMYLSRWLLGKPSRITSTFNTLTGREVEDNAVSVIEFENKAIAIVETGFVTPHSPFSLEIYGTEGTLLIGGTDNAVRVTSNKAQSTFKGWVTPSELPKPLPTAIEQWVSSISNRGEIHFGLEEAIQLSELMEKAYQSHREGCQVAF